eukprot:CCRYP_009258-RA/>CCRYP_009258-RA protein AED:0.03 eAED:0.03 QI:404/1/1/1/1/1/6/245/1277
MKLSPLLAASSIPAALVSSSQASLHEKGRHSIFDGRQRSNANNAIDDTGDDDVADLIQQYHSVNSGFHSLDKLTFRQANSTNATVDGDMPSNAPTPFGASITPPPSLVADDGFYYEETVNDNDSPTVDQANASESASVDTSLSYLQFEQCKTDMRASDANGDSLLSYAEYMNFVKINAANNGYGQYLTGGPTLRLGNLPYEYTLAFYGTACLCALLGEGGDCCLGNRTSVHIYHSYDGENVTVVDNTTPTPGSNATPGVGGGGGNATTIDVGGAENDDFDSGGVVDVDVGGGGTNATTMPTEYENSLWRDLPLPIQYAYTVLGYSQTSWDDGFPIPESRNMTWDELTLEMRGAASYIGYTQQMWDGQTTARRRRRMDVLGNANATVVDGGAQNGTVVVGGAQNDSVVEAGEENETGLQALLDQEKYTRNFCTEVYLAHGITKSPSHAPTTYPPTLTKVTMTPSVASSETITRVPSTSPPVVEMSSATPTYNPTSGTGAPIPSSPVSLPPVGGGNAPTPNPIVSLPVSFPPVGVGNVPTAMPLATGGTGAPILSTPVSFPPVGVGNVPTPNPNPLPTTTPPISLSTSTPTISRSASFPPTPGSSTTVTTPPVISSTASPTGKVVTVTFPPSSASSDVHSVFIQYGISSNCGVTAFDVLNANDNTIADGLISATESLVVNILNSTFPRNEDAGTRGGGHKIFHEELTKTYAEIYAEAGAKKSGDDVSKGFELTNMYVSNNLGLISKPIGDSNTGLDESVTEMESTNVETSSYLTLSHEQSRLFDVEIDTNDTNDRTGRNKRKRKKKIRQSKQKALGSNSNTRKLPSLITVTPHEYRRNLVYYTPAYPVTITDVEDVLDQACPAGVNCMRVFSTVKVVLEEGDNADAVDIAITQGVAAAFNDGSFFQAIPPQTIFCPGETAPPFTSSTDVPAPTTLAPASAPLSSQPSAGLTSTETQPSSGSPTPFESVTNEPSAGTANLSSGAPSTLPTAGFALSTSQPSPGSIATPTIAPAPGLTGSESTSPSTVSIAFTSKPTLGATNVPPWALPADTEAPTVGVGAASSIPTFTPTATPTKATETSLSPTSSSSSANTDGASSPSSSASLSPVGNLRVEITYDIANDCGLDSEAIMNETNNTLKTGLIAATTVSAIDILNQTFPRGDGTPSKKRGVRARRQLKHNTLTSHYSLTQTLDHAVHRNLVYYTDEFPVTIDRIIDVTENCPEGNSCLLIVSTITTVLEPGDDSDAVKNALVDGMTESFNTGSFYENIPPDTIICPGERRK